MSLTKEEQKELAQLISMIEISETWGVRDITRRAYLESHATDAQLKRVLQKALGKKMGSEYYYEVYDR